jgi:heme/copper-type cytochrome/quinol oxidase subunit 3
MSQTDIVEDRGPGVETPGHALTETPEELAYELRAQEGSIWTGTRLLMGVAIFTYASLAFAYFYLRSSDSFALWRPAGITAPTAYGAAIMALMIAAAGLAVLSTRRLKSNQAVDFQVAGWTTVLCGLTALGLQILELTHLPFFPGSSGYSSCFIGWAAINFGTIVGSLYWSETLLARFLRLRRAFAEEGGASSSPLPAARLFRANADGCAAFWCFVAVAEIFFWLLFYVI